MLMTSVVCSNYSVFQVGITGLSNELDTLISPITTLVVNTVKRDIQHLITPVIQNTLQTVINENAPTDLSQIFGWTWINFYISATYSEELGIMVSFLNIWYLCYIFKTIKNVVKLFHWTCHMWFHFTVVSSSCMQYHYF